MANYSIVVDTSNFKPFDIATPLTVLRDYRDAYYRYEDALNKIAEENGQFVLPEPDENNAQQKSIFDTYNKYNDDFRRISDDFSKGMNWENAQWVRSINRRYGNEVKPIKQAVQDFNTWQDNMNNIRTQVGGSAIIDNNNLTVYDFYGGKKPKLKFADGNKIAKKASDYVKSYLEGTQAPPKPVQSTMEGYFELVSGGISPEKAAEIQNAKYEAINGNYNGSMKDLLLGLKDIVDKDTEGFSLNSKQRAFGYAVQGAMSGVPKMEVQYMQNLDLDRDSKRLSMAATRQQMHNDALMEPLKRQYQQLVNQEKALDVRNARLGIGRGGSSGSRGYKDSLTNRINDLKLQLADTKDPKQQQILTDEINRLTAINKGKSSNPADIVRGLSKADFNSANVEYYVVPPGIIDSVNKPQLVKVTWNQNIPTITAVGNKLFDTNKAFDFYNMVVGAQQADGLNAWKVTNDDVANMLANNSAGLSKLADIMNSSINDALFFANDFVYKRNPKRSSTVNNPAVQKTGFSNAPIRLKK